MKTKTKKLLFILISVVSVMAIIITASQIYNIIDNQKVIDNEISGIDGEEGAYQKCDIDIFNETNPEAGYNWIPSAPAPAPPTFPKMYYSDWTTGDSSRARFAIAVQWGGLRKTVVLSSHIKEETINSKYNYNVKLVWNNETTYSDSTNTTPQKINSTDDFLNIIFQNIPLYTGSLDPAYIISYVNEQFGITGIMYNYTYDTDAFTFTFAFVNYIECNIELEKLENGIWVYDRSINYFTMARQNNTINIAATSYSIESNSISFGNQTYFPIEFNELLQVNTRVNNQKLSEYIYEQIIAEWSEGKELATIKCSIGEYYDENGNLAVSTQNNNLPMIFNIGDLVIPYIAVANGQTEPLSLKLNGTPKVFKVTQIRPYFDGAFWQELTLQEHTK